MRHDAAPNSAGAAGARGRPGGYMATAAAAGAAAAQPATQQAAYTATAGEVTVFHVANLGGVVGASALTLEVQVCAAASR